ncbi:hypothetical protein [Burkholderia pseudomallei]|uniref:hypothetical protein n=1 Tax=Burkholderia pseudomallei TaxID=28450 RepID=UPI0005366356|nr:hypothetical protein [Burkholderia pseudomallei]KGV27746.1 hypothetical protein X894_3577 [Burkholderia pseudomallei MSHR4462]
MANFPPISNDLLPVSIAVADGAILSALISIQIKDAADQDAARERFRAWIHSYLDQYYVDPAFPEALRSATRARVDSIFDNSAKLAVSA